MLYWYPRIKERMMPRSEEGANFLIFYNLENGVMFRIVHDPFNNEFFFEFDKPKDKITISTYLKKRNVKKLVKFINKHLEEVG